MQGVKSSKCMLMLIWMISLVLIPAALLGTPTMVYAAEVTQIKLCVNPSGLTRIPGANERCRPSEKLVQWDVSGSQEVSGSQGGAVTVIDKSGKTVGPLVESNAVVLTVGTERVLVGIGPKNFRNLYGLYFYRTGPDCTGTRLVDPSTDLLLPPVRVLGATGYYGGRDAQQYSVASFEDYSSGTLKCWPISPPVNYTLTPAKTVDLSVFTPEFSLKP